jgi:hypothetical protein
MDAKRLANERKLKLGIGLVGATEAFWFAWLYFRVMRHQNPMALVYLICAAIALFPALGVGMASVERPMGIGSKLWVVFATGTALLLMPLAWYLS